MKTKERASSTEKEILLRLIMQNLLQQKIERGQTYVKFTLIIM
jgi:hypothetical protein